MSITNIHLDRPMFFACTRDNITSSDFENLERLRDDVKRSEESNGGGLPITVRGVGGLVAVVVVVGAGRHDMVVEGLERVLRQQ
jgi:hypothetical protein